MKNFFNSMAAICVILCICLEAYSLNSVRACRIQPPTYLLLNNKKYNMHLDVCAVSLKRISNTRVKLSAASAYFQIKEVKLEMQRSNAIRIVNAFETEVLLEWWKTTKPISSGKCLSIKCKCNLLRREI